MSFLWGFQDSIVNTQTSTILGFEFENNSEPFAIFNIVQSVAVVLFAFIEVLINDRTRFFIYNIIIGVVGIIFCGMTLLFKYKEQEGSEKPIFKYRKNEQDQSIYEYSSGIRLDETISEMRLDGQVEDLQPILNGTMFE